MHPGIRNPTRLCACALLLIGCSDGNPTESPAIASVGVVESSALVALNGTKMLTPVARDADDREIDGLAFTWSSSDGTIATVDNSGLVSGLRLGGPVTITVASGGKTGSVHIFVTPAGIMVTPMIDSLLPGQSAQFTASAVDANGTPIPGVPVQWSLAFAANSQTAATISPTGLVTANSAGVVTVLARIAGGTGSTSFGIPSVFDGPWTGIDGGLRRIELDVRFGLITAFRMPSIPEPGCSDKWINATINGSPIAANGAYEFAIGVTPSTPSAPALVRGTFTTPATATGTVPSLDLGARTCNDGTSQPSMLGPANFTITHR